MTRETHILAARLVLAALAVLLAVLPAGAQPRNLPPVESKRFKRVIEFFPAPHERQMKTLLEGASFKPAADGKYLITGGVLRTFRPTGELESIGEAAEAVYDPAGQTVSSSGWFKARKLDGQFYLEGRGFLWQQTNSILTISNESRLLAAGISDKR
jgi:hypothetical protein